MKKQVSLILALLLVLSLFSVTLSEGDPIKLQFMGWEASVYETEANVDALNRFMADTPGVTVEYIANPYAEHHTKILTMMAAGAAPDTFYMDPPYYNQFVEKDLLLDLTDLFYDYYEEDEFVQWSWDKMKVNDRIYGIDSCIVGWVMIYNKAMFDAAGLDYPSADPEDPWTWDQMLDAAQKLSDVNGTIDDVYGLYGYTDINIWQDYLFNEGISLFTEGYGAFEPTDPVRAGAIAEEMRKLIKEYNVSPEASFTENIGMSPNQMLQSGKVGMVLTGTFALQELSKMDMSFEYDVAAPPVMVEGNAATVTHCSYNIAGWAGTKHPEEAFKLITYQASTDFQLPFVRDGLWMTNRTELYLDENTDEWFNPDVLPEGMLTLKNLYRDARIREIDLVPNSPEIKTIMTEEWEMFLYSDLPIDQAIGNMANRINPILMG